MRRLLLSLPLALGLSLAPPQPAPAAISLFGMRNSLVQFALKKLSTPGQMEITARDVADAEDGSTELIGVKIADRDGVWLEVGALGLDWSASAILTGALTINQLYARDVHLIRQPLSEDVAVEAKEPAEPRGLFDWPRMPLDTVVEQLRLEGVRIDAGAISERAVAFDAGGAFRDEGHIQSASFDLARIDGIEGGIDLEYLRDFDAGTLRMKLDAREQAGGLVGALARLPEDSAVSAHIDADGPLTDWRAELDVQAERVIEVQGGARVVIGPPLSIDMEIDATPGAALDPQIAAVLGETARIVARAEEGEDGIIRIRQAGIDSPNLTLDVDGTYDRSAGAFDAKVDLDADAGLSRLAEGVEFQGARFTGEVAGDFGAFTATGDLALDGFSTQPVDLGSAALKVDVGKDGAAIRFDADGEVRGLRLDRIQPQTIGPATLSARGVYDPETALSLERLEFGSNLLEIDASGEVAADGGASGIDYSLSTPNLRGIADAYGQDAAGKLQMSGRLDGALAAPHLTGEIAARELRYQGEDYGAVKLTHDATLGETPQGEVALRAEGSPYGPVAFDGRFQLADQQLALSGLEATALGARVAGEVDYALESGLAEGALDLEAADLAQAGRRLGLDLAGEMRGRVVLIARDGAQDAKLDVAAARLSALGAALNDARIDATLTDLLRAPGFDGEIEALNGDYPQMQAGFERLRFAGSAADLTGRATLDGVLSATGARFQDNRIGALRLDLTGEELRTARPVLSADARAERIEAGGFVIPSAALEAQLKDRADGALTATLSAPSARGAGATLGRLTLNADATGAYTDNPALDARLRLSGLDAGAARLSGLRLDAKGPRDALQVTLDAQGTTSALPKDRRDDPDTPISLSARARVDAGTPLSAVLTAARARAGDKDIRLVRPLTIDAQGPIRIENLALALPGGMLTGAVTAHDAGLSGALALRLEDMRPLAELAQAPITRGALDVDARFDTRPSRASARVDADIRELNVDGIDPELGLIAAVADARWNGSTLRVDAELTPGRNPQAYLTLTTPMRAGQGLVPVFAPGFPVDAAVKWDGRLGDLWALVPTADHVLDGDLHLDLRAQGPIANPRIFGDVAMRDGSYQFLTTGTILTDLIIDSEVAADRAFEIDLRAEDGAGAPVSLIARIGADGALDATLTSTNAVLVRRDDATARISLDMTAQGPLASPAVSGEVRIDQAEVRLVNDTPPSVASLGEIRIKGAPRVETDPPAGAAIPLDIRIRAPRDVFVRGRGLDSEWRVELDIGGDAADPEIVGEIERVRGVLMLVGAEFDLEQGEIAFDGGTDPTLAIAALRENDGITGGVYVRGRASDPRITFESTPALPEGEVLPRVLFGKAQQSLSPSEALQIASGIATLLDGTGGFLDGIRATAGVDVLRIDAGGSGGPSVTAGKNLADNVFVGVTQPLDGGSAKVKVEVDVFENLTVDTEVGGGEGDSVGVNWKMDF